MQLLKLFKVVGEIDWQKESKYFVIIINIKIIMNIVMIITVIN